MAKYRKVIEKFQKLVTSGKLKIRIVRGRMVVEMASNILFPSGKAALHDEGEKALEELAAILKTITPPLGDGKPLTTEDVEQALTDLGIVFGIDGEKIREYEDAKLAAEKGDSDVQREAAAKKTEELKDHEGTEILNLTYRQGPDLPILDYGFPDSHFVCFPYESRRTGIYPAGTVRQPMDGLGSRMDGTGASLKAIQCVEMTSRGEAVHPRAGDKWI